MDEDDEPGNNSVLGEVMPPMTNQQMQEMYQQGQKEKRAARVESGPRAYRINHKKAYDTKGNKGNARARGFDS